MPKLWDAIAGFAFRANDLTAEDFSGYYTGLSGADQTAFLLEDTSEMARRNVSIEPGQWYPVRLEVSGNNFVFYVDDNPVAENQFPKYDAVDPSYTAGQLALRVTAGQAEFRNVSVELYQGELPIFEEHRIAEQIRNGDVVFELRQASQWGAALYFASAASSFTTGSVLRVDGGER